MNIVFLAVLVLISLVLISIGVSPVVALGVLLITWLVNEERVASR